MSVSARRSAAALAAALFVTHGIADDWQPPEPALSRKAYEMQYPNQTATAAALEIELLAAKLGIEAAAEARPTNRPDAAIASELEPAHAATFDYVVHELQDPSDAVAPPPDLVRRFLEDNDATIAALVAAASGRREVAWDLNLTLGKESPVPNWYGLTQVQRVLAARALLDCQRGNPYEALQAVEGIWRIARSLAERPELLSQTVATNQARFAVGLLRKLRAPGYGWESRLREAQFFSAFLASFQNDPWAAAESANTPEDVETVARIYRRFADGLIERSACAWRREDLQHAWDVAISGEPDPTEIEITQFPESIVAMVRRSYRLLLDSELTALILEARAERDASREDEWPARLANVGSAACPGRFYTYRRAGGVTISLEGPVPPEEDRGLALPLTFRGAPPPTRTPTPRPATTVTPTPGPGPSTTAGSGVD